VAVGSDDFTSQCAQLANKLGKGEEAMQALVQERFGGVL
jgi:hypothetical protein